MNKENIQGYDVVAESLGQCVTKIISWIYEGTHSRYFVCANPHSLHLADSDSEFKEALMSADLITPDGVGIIFASMLNKGAIRKRITGSDIFEALNKELNKNGAYSVFFLGSTDETLRKIKKKYEREFPNIKLAGVYSPPFKTEFSTQDTENMITIINEVKPDVLWVGMTAPKQEKWIYENINKMDVKFAGAIGAVFDFYVGNIKRSHPIFQKLGLEWLPRLVQEPRRLWKRNFVSNPCFLYKVLKTKFIAN